MNEWRIKRTTHKSILQRRRVHGSATGAWCGVAHCRTKGDHWLLVSRRMESPELHLTRQRAEDAMVQRFTDVDAVRVVWRRRVTLPRGPRVQVPALGDP